MIRFNPFAIARLFSWKQQDVFSRLYTYHWVIGCIFLLISHTDASAQGGGLDPLFNPADHGLVTTEGANNDVFAIGVQPDGNILIAGAFTTFNGKPANRIARIWPDGSLDASFNPGGAGADGSVNKIALQADGKIILAGSFTQYNGSPANRILRLNADGSLDTAYRSGTGFNGPLNKLVLQPDGKLLVAGNFTRYKGLAARFLVRLNNDGELDPGFTAASVNSPVQDIGLQADGKLIVGMFSGNFLQRLFSDGTADPSFQSPTVITSVIALAVQSDDKIILSLSNSLYTSSRFLRLEQNGSIDAGFDSAQNGAQPVASCIALQPDGKILIGRSHAESELGSPVSRLNSDGSPDNSFQYDFLRDIGQTIFTIALQADGKILTGESLQSVYNNNERYPRIDFYRASKDFRINRYQSNGSRDHDFCINSTQTGANRTVYASAQQADGKMLIGGNFFSYNGTAANYIARIDSDGSRDLSFNAGGSGPDSRVNAIAVQPDGKILIGGMFKFYNGIPVNQLVRLLPDGSLDNSFNYPTAMGIGRVTKILLQPDGKILVSWFVGSSSLAVQRLNPDGSRDAGFNASIPASYLQSYVFIHSIALQPDGKILVGGSFGASMSGLSGYRNLTRLETNGTRDLSFNPTAPQTQVGPTADVYDIRILPDGKIMLVGGFQGYNASGTVVPAAGIIRLLSTGIPDAGFNASGSGIVGTATTLSVLPDTRMLVGGLIQSYNHTPVNNLVCIQADGNIDGLFNAGESGASDAVWTIAQSPTGTHTLIGGAFTRYNDQGKNRLARISLGCSGFYQSDTVFICSSQLPYTWHNQSYAAPGTYTTTLVSASGCDSIRTLFLQVTAGVLEGPSKICGLIATGNTADYRMAAPPGTLFTWSVTQPTNMTILSGAGTNHIQVRFEPGFTNGVVYVRATNPSCGINLNRYLSISRTIPATPSGIQSSAGSICAYIGTSNTVVYSIARIASATAYNWTTGTGTIVTHPNGTGINDTIITVRFLINFATSPITVQAVNECGVSETRSVTIRRDPPALPGLISGTTNVCNNLLTPFISGGPAPHGSYTDYAVPYVPDVRYIWNLPTPYVYGNGSNYISAGFESGFSSGTISVQATNGCGSSASRSITVRTVTASAPGSISTVNAGSCPLRRFIYSVASLPMNADSIQWSVPGGGIIESGQGTTSISVVYPSGTILGYVTAQGTNHCSISSLRKIHINLPACPTSLWTFHTDPAATMFDKTSVRANSKSRMLVYPNPSVADFTAEYTGTGAAQVSLVVMDAMGKIIGKYWVNAGQSLRFGANLTPGIYFIETREANELHTTRLVKL